MPARVAAALAGVWLMVSPAVLGYVGTTAEASDRTVGPVAAAASFVAMWAVVRSLRWITLPIGMYCLFAPWLIGFPTDAAISNASAGVVLIVTAFVGGPAEERFGGGWESLWR